MNRFVPDLPPEPPEDDIVGYDYKDMELYGNETGIMVDGEFIHEDDIKEYMIEAFGLVTSEEAFRGGTV